MEGLAISTCNVFFTNSQPLRRPSRATISCCEKPGGFPISHSQTKKRLTELDVLESSPNWQIKREFDFLGLLNKNEQISISQFSDVPFDVAAPSNGNEVEERQAYNADLRLYTIGYEGQSIESYLNRLLSHDVAVLCDVRKNPMSRKFGFSKSSLSRFLRQVGIRYIHIPTLGIESAHRRNIETQEARSALFNEYEVRTLKQRNNELNLLMSLMRDHRRLALTCFEADHTTCHRHVIANKLLLSNKKVYEVLHI